MSTHRFLPARPADRGSDYKPTLHLSFDLAQDNDGAGLIVVNSSGSIEHSVTLRSKPLVVSSGVIKEAVGKLVEDFIAVWREQWEAYEQARREDVAALHKNFPTFSPPKPQTPEPAAPALGSVWPEYPGIKEASDGWVQCVDEFHFMPSYGSPGIQGNGHVACSAAQPLFIVHPAPRSFHHFDAAMIDMERVLAAVDSRHVAAITVESQTDAAGMMALTGKRWQTYHFPMDGGPSAFGEAIHELYEALREQGASVVFVSGFAAVDSDAWLVMALLQSLYQPMMTHDVLLPHLEGHGWFPPVLPDRLEFLKRFVVERNLKAAGV